MKYIIPLYVLLLFSTQLHAETIDNIFLVPPSVGHTQSHAAIRSYAENPQWQVRVKEQRGRASIALSIPSPFRNRKFLRNSLASSILPTVPKSSIYRFKYLDIVSKSVTAVPFRYVEVDWNMEGKPRGPNNSFITPHYDFHFYTKSLDFVRNNLKCRIGSSIPCDAAKTGYKQMRRFLDLPPAKFLPRGYYPDVGSSIATMGLHNLDGNFDYTVENVNHSPVIIYGTFDGELLFLEASITLYALQDAIHTRRVEWSIPQPQAYAYDWWPKKLVLEYVDGSEMFILTLV